MSPSGITAGPSVPESGAGPPMPAGGGVPPAVRNRARSVTVLKSSASSAFVAAVELKEMTAVAAFGSGRIPA